MRKVLKYGAYSLSFLTLAGVVFLGGLVHKLLVKTSLAKDTEIGDRLDDLLGVPSAQADVPYSQGSYAPSPSGPCPTSPGPTSPGPTSC